MKKMSKKMKRIIALAICIAMVVTSVAGFLLMFLS